MKVTGKYLAKKSKMKIMNAHLRFFIVFFFFFRDILQVYLQRVGREQNASLSLFFFFFFCDKSFQKQAFILN